MEVVNYTAFKNSNKNNGEKLLLVPGNGAALPFPLAFGLKAGEGERRAFLSGLVTLPVSVCVVCVRVLGWGGSGVPLWFDFFFSRIMAGSHTLLYMSDPGL